MSEIKHNVPGESTPAGPYDGVRALLSPAETAILQFILLEQCPSAADVTWFQFVPNQFTKAVNCRLEVGSASARTFFVETYKAASVGRSLYFSVPRSLAQRPDLQAMAFAAQEAREPVPRGPVPLGAVAGI